MSDSHFHAVAVFVAAAMAALSTIFPAASADAATPETKTVVIFAAGAVSIEAPITVDPGAAVAVTVSGASGGRIELWGPVTSSGAGSKIAEMGGVTGPVKLNAPHAPGSYELRYFTAAGEMADRKAIDVAAVPITLSVPQSIGAGVESMVEWRGPARPGDMLQIVDPATGEVLSEVSAEGAPGALNTTMIRGPERSGNVELRYWSGPAQASLRSLATTVGRGDTWLSTPIEVYAGDAFEAEWKGAAGPDFAYRIVKPDGGEVVSEVPAPERGPVSLTAPKRHGAYRVQFVNVVTGFVVADLPLDVDRR